MVKSINTRTCYKLIGSDFSQQEVRVLAEMSQDQNLIKAYKENKDIYATVAADVYHKDYWECMEHYQDGSSNLAGEKRRASCKSIVLGIIYSRGANAIAEQIGSTREEAEKIIEDFYRSFPTVKAWMDNSLHTLQQEGYVEDFYGRRRRLPDINLKPYIVSLSEKELAANFNPILGCQDRTQSNAAIDFWKSIIGTNMISANIYKLKDAKPNFSDEMSNKKYDKIMKAAAKPQAFTAEIMKLIKENNRLYNELQTKTVSVYNSKTRSSDVFEITPEFKLLVNRILKNFPIKFLKDIPTTEVTVDAFTGRRAQAVRQCVNARIQGSAATITKIAMNKILVDPELNSYGFRLSIGVHDELIGEIKDKYAERGAARLCEIMKTCVSDIISVPFKCDPSIDKAWYFSKMALTIQKRVKELKNNGQTNEEAIASVSKEFSEFRPEEIQEFLAYTE